MTLATWLSLKSMETHSGSRMGLQPILEWLHSFQWESCRKRHRCFDSVLTLTDPNTYMLTYLNPERPHSGGISTQINLLHNWTILYSKPTLFSLSALSHCTGRWKCALAESPNITIPFLPVELQNNSSYGVPFLSLPLKANRSTPFFCNV